jgi:hypothetical protein
MCFQHLICAEKQGRVEQGLQSCGGSTRIVARNSRIAGGGGEAVGRQ